MKQFLLTTLFILPFLWANAQSTTVDAATFAKKIKSSSKPVIVDVRTPEEYANGHIKNAINISWTGSTFEKETNKLDKSKPVYVYCQAGGRSAAAVAKMKKMGFKTIVELKNGMNGWESAKMPVVK